ncbi:MAG: flagellar FLiS export co-chaperone, partial [Helicobacter sp.]|nr:flagellar FLiS export co-chaperone [Helicobacter sp.]
MLHSINAYGIGNLPHTQNLTSTQQVKEQNEPVAEIHELPKISDQALEIRKFSDGVKGANEIIGAMQIADITLSALGNQAKSLGEVNAQNIDILDSIAKNAQFKGESLFGRELSLSFGGESISLSLPMPSQILQQESPVIQAFSDKHQEISEKLTSISQLIE